MANKAANGNGSIRRKTVTSRGKTYEVWEGRFIAGHDPATGKSIQKSVSGKTQKEVREKLRAAVKAVDDGTYQMPTKMTVAEWLNTWMETFCTHLKPLTVSAYENMIRLKITPAIGAMPLQAVRGVQIQQLYNSMASAGLSPKTIKNVSGVLHKAYAVAVKQGYCAANPCDAAELPKAKKHEIRPLQDAEVPVFLKAIECHQFRNSYALCLFAGLREAECLGLSWDAVDFEKRRITVCQQLQKSKTESSTYHIVDSTKNGKTRVITPPAVAFDYLADEKRRQAENRLRAGRLWSNKDNLVFTNEAGRYIVTETWRRGFKRLVATIGRPDLRCHDLRHSCATIALAAGSDIKSVQTLLGHATASFTLDVYSHATDKMVEDTAARMQNYFDNLKKA